MEFYLHKIGDSYSISVLQWLSDGAIVFKKGTANPFFVPLESIIIKHWKINYGK